tara:strand:- start:936 stop:1844 length:909 start_codon:yes stop_codon:yes gene_type:complete
MKEYLNLLRIDHWVKNIFVIPGLIFSFFLGGKLPEDFIQSLFLTLISLFSACSANYTLNEWLDRETDKEHPEKKDRASVKNKLNSSVVYFQYFLLFILSCITSYISNQEIFFCMLLLIFMGIIYNVKPFRSKEIPVLDVLSESINNPIRFLIGWYLLDNIILPPSALLISYWFGGAFLMNAKRLTEFNKIKDLIDPSVYRKSFSFYTINRLISLSLFYSTISISLLIVFITKYKLELILILPLVSLLFSIYQFESFIKNSYIDAPEKLYKNKKIIFVTLLTTILFLTLFFIDIQVLNNMFEN